MAAYRIRGRRREDRHWDADRVRQLRAHLGLTQQQFAAEINARQQTVSEWERGHYRPRGPSARLLSLIAEDAEFQYGVSQSGVVESGGLEYTARPASVGEAPRDADQSAGEG